MSDEEWRPVVGWEGLYEVSSHGRVRSLDRRVTNHLTSGTSLRKGRMLKPFTLPLGYSRVALSGGGREQREGLHRVVCRAFKGEAPEGKPFALHSDGNPRNNRSDNLRWGSHSENMEDSVRHGTHQYSKRTRCPQGHPYSTDNTYVRRNGNRGCKACSVESNTRARRRGFPTGDKRHGTNSGYANSGCRCTPCKEARREYIEGLR